MLDKYLPPTDSLYKFMAISGLMLIFLGFVPRYWLYELEKDVIENEKQADLFQQELKQATERGVSEWMTKAASSNKYYEELIKTGKLSDQSLNEVGEALKESTDALKKWEAFKEELNSTYRTATELKLSNEEIRAKVMLISLDFFSKGNKDILTSYLELERTTKLLKLNLRKIDSLGNLIFFISLVGSALTVFGFGLWYKKVQKPSDLFLAQQLNDPSRQPHSRGPKRNIKTSNRRSGEDITRRLKRQKRRAETL